jgi:hypothetical protein
MDLRVAFAFGSSLLFITSCMQEPSGVAAESSTLGTEPVDSARALPPEGGCHPVGVAATGIDQFPLINPEWAPVIEGASPFSAPVLLHGTVVESRVSREDFPSTHVTFDQNTFIDLDASDRGLLATGNLAFEEGHLELEWETGSYPAWAWAGPGDRIVALGRWIFDCGHPDAAPGACHGTFTPCLLDTDCGGVACEGAVFNYQSELHSPQAVAVIREGRGAALKERDDGEDEDEDGPARAVPVTRADVLVSSDGGAAADACVVTAKPTLGALLGAPCFPLSAPLALLPPGAGPLNAVDFELDVPLPARRGRDIVVQVVPRETPPAFGSAVPARLEVREVLDAAAPHLHVVVHMREAVGGRLPTGFAATILAGWRSSGPGSLAHLRVTLDGVLVHDALKPPPAVPGLPVPDGWAMEAAVDGDWHVLREVEAIAASDQGRTVPVHAVFDSFVPRDGALRLVASAASRTCNDTLFGRTLLDDLTGFGNDLQLAFACLGDRRQLDAGTVEASFAAPRFGARAEPYLVRSEGGAAAFSLAFRIERIDQE